MIVSLVVLSLGGYVTSHVYSFQTSFEFFDSASHFPYYKIIYYGAVSQAAFGILGAIMSLLRLALRGLRDYWLSTRTELKSS
ncbi:hypothetical protein PITC_017570 [Penicillium italicum]|uniref:Uncharacterized protein n=1 Tax=Penicillium italicum TaxID=40296 RepID=A0A0A2KXM4_PENIT|nr:hypothetical protein PITC_017570 [Penicillium italicum]